MKFSHIFIKRPIFAAVLSVLILIGGGLAYISLPVSQFPEVAPPTVEVVALYPGANAQVLSETVAAPLEKEINGVEGMIYMTSQSSADGRVVLQITFELGTDLDRAQVQVQNRVAIAEPRLPEASRRLGITTKKISPDILLIVNLVSSNKTYDMTFMANYAALQLKDELARIKGIGDIQIFGASEYAMRIWLDPDKIASMDMTAGEVVASLRAQNVQIASGTLNTLPSGKQSAFEINIQTQGKLVTPEQFENVIIKADGEGRLVRLKDIGRVELGAQNYTTKGYLGKEPSIAMPIFQQPGGNALETSADIQAKMAELSKNFPADLEYRIAYNPTEFIQKSVDEVYYTIFEAVILKKEITSSSFCGSSRLNRFSFCLLLFIYGTNGCPGFGTAKSHGCPEVVLKMNRLILLPLKELWEGIYRRYFHESSCLRQRWYVDLEPIFESFITSSRIMINSSGNLLIFHRLNKAIYKLIWVGLSLESFSMVIKNAFK